MSEQKSQVRVTVNAPKTVKGYMVTHPKGHTYFMSSLGSIKNTYGVSEDQLRNMGWDIQALEG